MKPNRKTIFILCLSLTFSACASSVAAQHLAQYRDFTSERREVLVMMSNFFHETICLNFPDNIDTISYRKCFQCIFNMGGKLGIDYILDVDREKLNKINCLLFEDNNYYFFFSKLIRYPSSKPQSQEEYERLVARDTVPTIRNYPVVRKGISRETKQGQNKWWWKCTYNSDGYMRVVTEQYSSNPLIKRMMETYALTGEYHIMTAMQDALCCNMAEVTKPEVSGLMAVLFWRCLCYYGGIDLINRKSFCASCEANQ